MGIGMRGTKTEDGGLNIYSIRKGCWIEKDQNNNQKQVLQSVCSSHFIILCLLIPSFHCPLDCESRPLTGRSIEERAGVSFAPLTLKRHTAKMHEPALYKTECLCIHDKSFMFYDKLHQLFKQFKQCNQSFVPAPFV